MEKKINLGGLKIGKQESDVKLIPFQGGLIFKSRIMVSQGPHEGWLND